jgi:ubiquinone/menaquinone biosynthesis C-methylase UbiE
MWTLRLLPGVRFMAAAIVAALVLAGPRGFSASLTYAQQHEADNPTRIEHIFKALAVKPGAVIADVGAGGGMYTSKLAKAVGPTGRVIAVDISPRAIELLRARVQREALTNVDIVESAVDDPRLAPASVDAVLVVYAYHEMTEHAAMLRAMRAALKPGGRLVIVEPISPRRRDVPRDEQTRAHQLAPDVAIDEIRAAGFRLLHFVDPLPGHHEHDGHSEWMLAAAPKEQGVAATTTPQR